MNRGVESNNEYNASLWWNLLLFALQFSGNNICIRLTLSISLIKRVEKGVLCSIMIIMLFDVFLTL